MKNLYLLIKPASGNCNLECKYCFYRDEINNRNTPSHNYMSVDLAEKIIKKALYLSDISCCFSFQGGEPFLAGLTFFKAFVETVKKYNTKNIKVFYSIQTNGTLLDENWAQFLSSNHFLTGISLDGYEQIHNLYRRTCFGGTTFSQIINAVSLLEKFNADYNILTVVTSKSAKKADKIYQFYKQMNFNHQQYIPCLDPISRTRGKEPYSLTPESYSYFLKCLFDKWYTDILNKKPIHIRYFENLITALRGGIPESCGMNGVCSHQYVIESDGSVYPCDFYVFDNMKLGSFAEDDIEEIEKKRRDLNFIDESLKIPDDCNICKYYPLCRNGCKRERVDNGSSIAKNYYCNTYRDFFDYSIERLCLLANTV
ncbi:anaerobic sulfatase maturase [Lachnospiraceae bacterium NSJ-143]|nr:anaerobic sulfatase maturase [Lachnospiraceae bacterium NSJ-143]